MNTGLIVGLALISGVLFVIIKLLLGLKDESRLLTYEFPSGWEKKMIERYPLYKSLTETQREIFKKKVQIQIAKRKLVGLESLKITIDIRLAIACEISLITINQKKMNPYLKLSPIAILPFDKYEEFKNRNSFTLYWKEEENSIYLETPTNKLLKNSFFLFLKVDKRLKGLEDLRLEEIANDLSQSVFPVEQDLNSIFSTSIS
jgi:hypothetical protein